MVIIHKNWNLLKAKLTSKDSTNIDKRIGSENTLVVVVDNKKYDPDIPVFGRHKLDAFLVSFKSRGNVRERHHQLSVSRNTEEIPSPSKRQRKLERVHINKTQPPPQSPPQPKPQSPPKSIPQPSPQPQPKLQSLPKSKPQPSPQQQPKPQSLPKSKPQPSPQPKPQPSPQPKPHPPSKSKPQPSPQPSSKTQPQLPPQAVLSSSPGPSRLIKKVTKKRGVHSSSTYNNSTSNNSTSPDLEPGLSFWDCPTDKLVIIENIVDEYRALDEESDEETDMARNIKKIKYPTPTKTVAPKPRLDSPPKSRPTPTPKSSPPKPKSPSNIKSDSPPPVQKIEKPKEPNWPETVKKFEENQLHIVYKDLCFFKSHIMSDERAKALPRLMVTKCLQDDLAFLFLDSLKLIFELNYKDGSFLSEIVQRLKRKLNINCGVMKYKSNIDPNQIRDAYKRAVSEIGVYAKNENITFTLPYYDFIFLTSSCIQPTAPNQNSSTPITQPSVDSRIQSSINLRAQAASVQAESKGPEPELHPAASLPPEHPIKTRLSPLQSLNKFNVNFFPAPDVKPKVENGNKQENTDPTIERRVTLGVNKKGEKVFQIRRSINMNKAQVFKYRL